MYRSQIDTGANQSTLLYGTTAGLSVFEVLVRVTDTEGAYLDAQFTLTAK